MNFGGIAIVGNTANASTQGTWQYSSNSGTNWFAVGTVADGATALAVAAGSTIRFVPVTNFAGTPPALLVRALDDTYVGGFSTTVGTETRVNVNTTTNGTTTAIAAATTNLSILVNTAPVLSGGNGFTTITEDQTTSAGNLVSTLISGQFSDTRELPRDRRGSSPAR